MNKKLKATKEERARMDEVDTKQQDAIELISQRIEHLIWAVCVLTVIWGGVIILVLTERK